MSKKIRIKKGDRLLEVYEKAYKVVYASAGYHPVNEEREEGTAEEQEDYSTFTKSQLKKVKNDDLRAYLDAEGIEYKSEDDKDDLIALIVGE